MGQPEGGAATSRACSRASVLGQAPPQMRGMTSSADAAEEEREQTKERRKSGAPLVLRRQLSLEGLGAYADCLERGPEKTPHGGQAWE